MALIHIGTIVEIGPDWVSNKKQQWLYISHPYTKPSEKSHWKVGDITIWRSRTMTIWKILELIENAYILGENARKWDEKNLLWGS